MTRLRSLWPFDSIPKREAHHEKPQDLWCHINDRTTLLNLLLNLIFSLYGFPLNCRTGRRLYKRNNYSLLVFIIPLMSELQKKNRSDSVFIRGVDVSPSLSSTRTEMCCKAWWDFIILPDDIMVLESGRHIQVMKNKCICSESIWQPCSAPGRKGWRIRPRALSPIHNWSVLRGTTRHHRAQPIPVENQRQKL